MFRRVVEKAPWLRAIPSNSGGVDQKPLPRTNGQPASMTRVVMCPGQHADGAGATLFAKALGYLLGAGGGRLRADRAYWPRDY